MNFSEKLKKLRQSTSYTQEDLSNKIGVSLRTYKAYELDERRPRKHEIYIDLAKLFDVEFTSLIDDDKKLKRAGDQSSEKDHTQVVDEMLGLFAGGKLSLEDKKTVLDTLEEAYYIAKMRENQNEDLWWNWEKSQ